MSSNTAKKGKRGSGIAPYLMVSPAVFFLLIFTVYPVINLAYLSFYQYNLINPNKKYVGLANYQKLLFVRTDFLTALKNTAVFSLAHVFFLMLFALIFAAWLQKKKPVNNFAQTAIFTPHLVAMLSCSMIWAWLMDDAGLFNTVLKLFDLAPLRWLNSASTALMSIVIVSVWKSIGYYALVLVASLKAIPGEIYEAADMDNGSKINQFFHITIPMLSPQLLFLLVMITINSFKVFDAVSILTEGGPGDASNVIAYYIYDMAFKKMKVGYAAAGGIMLVVILSILTFIYFKVLNKRVHYQ